MDFRDYESVPIAELPAFEGRDILFVDVVGEQPGTSYQSRFGFSPERDPLSSAITIETPKREDFLAVSSEMEVEAKLVNLTKATHNLSAGVIDIHPLYGAVHGTKINSVCPGFLSGLQCLSDRLLMRIALVSNGHIFSDTLSDEASTIPNTFMLPGDDATKYLAYSMVAHGVNPNQYAKDHAASNGLVERWQAEFDAFNPSEIVTRDPMAMTLGAVALLMQTLNDLDVFYSSTARVRIETS